MSPYVATFWVLWYVYVIYLLFFTYRGNRIIESVWDFLKRLVGIVVPGSEPAVPTVREPDWADAADEVGFFDPIPEPLWDELELWTPAERDAFDLYATTEFIRFVDGVLAEHDKQILEAAKIRAWNDWERKMELSEEQIKAERERHNAVLAAQRAHAERMARRNGANLLPDDTDDVAALRVLNRRNPSRERRLKERLE